MDLLACIRICVSIFTWRQNIGMRSNRREMLFRESFAMEIVLNRRYLCGMCFGNCTEHIDPLLATRRIGRTNFQRIAGGARHSKCSWVFFTWIYYSTGQMLLQNMKSKWNQTHTTVNKMEIESVGGYSNTVKLRLQDIISNFLNWQMSSGLRSIGLNVMWEYNRVLHGFILNFIEFVRRTRQSSNTIKLSR